MNFFDNEIIEKIVMPVVLAITWATIVLGVLSCIG